MLFRRRAHSEPSGSEQKIGALELVNSSGTYSETVLYSFTEADGTGSGLTMDGAGNLYGTRNWSLSGAEAGNVFELLAQMVSFSPNSLSFSSQAIGTTSPAQTVTLTNSGIAALSITGITITGMNAGDFAQTNTCGASVAAVSGSCTINVTFTPTAAGTRTPSISIADNASGSPQTITLSGLAPDFGVQAPTLSPTSVTAGQSAKSTITITSLNGLKSAVNLTCSVSPTPSLAPTCTFTASSVCSNSSGWVVFEFQNCGIVTKGATMRHKKRGTSAANSCESKAGL